MRSGRVVSCACSMPLLFDARVLLILLMTLLCCAALADTWDPADDVRSGATALAAPTPGVQTHGPHTFTDSSDLTDWFSLPLTAGQVCWFQNTNSTRAIWLYVCDELGNDLKRFWLGGYGTPYGFVADQSGRFYLRVARYEYNSSYTLAYWRGSGISDAWDPADDQVSGATALAAPTETQQSHGLHTMSGSDWYDWFKLDLRAGHSCAVRVRSSNGYPSPHVFGPDGSPLAGPARYLWHTFTPSADGVHSLLVSNEQCRVELEYTLDYVELPLRDVWDPADNTSNGATALPAPTAAVQSHGPHAASSIDLEDWFTVDLTAGESYVFDLSETQVGLGYQLYCGTRWVWANYGVESVLGYTPTNSGAYYLCLKPADPNSPGGMYTLHYRNASREGDAWDPADNRVGGATPLLFPAHATQTHGPHKVGGSDWYDWFRVQLERGERYTFRTRGSTGRLSMILYGDAFGTGIIASTGWYEQGDLAIEAFEAPHTGTYTLRLYNKNEETTYSLEYATPVTAEPASALPPNTWTWRNPLPQGNNLNAVWGSSISNVIAVGDGGAILHYDGSGWTAMESGTGKDLRDVWGSAWNDLYAVGGGRPYDEDGVILHYDGARWQHVEHGLPIQDFVAVWGSGKDDVFVLDQWGGWTAAIAHFDGREWRIHATMDLYECGEWRDIWGSGPNDVYVVGYEEFDECDPDAVIFHFDGNAWTRVLYGGYGEISAVWGRGSNDVYAVADGARLLHYDGRDWARMTVGDSGQQPARIRGVTGTGVSLLVVGSGGSGEPTVWEYNGTLWNKTMMSDGSGLSAGWAGEGGGAFVVGESGLLAVRDGGRWATHTATLTDKPLCGVWGTSESDVYAVGGVSGQGAILHYDGTAWSSMALRTNISLSAVWGTGPANLYAVGSERRESTYVPVVLRGNGQSWRVQDSPVLEGIGTGSFADVWGSGPGDVYAVGGMAPGYGPNRGLICHYDGAGWTVVDRNRTGWPDWWRAVWGSGPDDVFVVGRGSTVFHYDGAGWAQMTLPAVDSWDDLADVWGTGPNDVYVIKQYGQTLYHYDGTSWKVRSIAPYSPYDGYQFALWGTDGNNLFAGLSHFDGSEWTRTLGFARRIYGVWGPNPNTVFAVGESGTILQYKGAVPAGETRFTAYNDLMWLPGQVSKDITTYTRGQGGALTDFYSGRPAQATLSVSGGRIVTHPLGALSAPGTDARAVFEGRVDCVGTLQYDPEPVTLAFGDLDPELRYEVVLFGNRANAGYTDRMSAVTLGGARSFVNASTAGAARRTTVLADDTTVICHGVNTANGYVARFTGVDPGPDGRFTLSVADGGSANPPKFYANAVMLRAVERGDDIGERAAWRYCDTGQDLGTAWRAPGYDDAAWAAGPGVLGYGDSFIDTPVTYGPDPQNKYITTYFRKAFMLNDAPLTLARLTLNARYDDGFVAYLNGSEVARRSMPAGPVGYGTLALNHEGRVYEQIDLTGQVDKLTAGRNVLAVEVHQRAGESSDLVWDASLELDAARALPVVEFAAAGGQGSEGTAIVEVDVILSDPADVPVTVQYRQTAGRAWPDTDYVAPGGGSSGTVTFEPGQARKRIAFAVTDDTRRETDESFTLRLGPAQNAVIGVVDEYTYVIIDNDRLVLPPGWTETAVPDGAGYVYDIWGSGPSDVFAVCYEGTVLHYDGTSWTSLLSVPDCTLDGVWGTSSTDVYVVGRSSSGMPWTQFIMHYDGSEWTYQQWTVERISQVFRDIWGTGPSDVYAVGRESMYFDGQSWTPLGFPDDGPLSVETAVGGSRREGVFVAGPAQADGYLWHLAGSPATDPANWEPLAMPPIVTEKKVFLSAIWGGAPSGAVYFLGMPDTDYRPAYPVVLRYTTRDGWTVTELAGFDLQWLWPEDIWGTAENNIYIAGVHVLHFDGTAWRVAVEHAQAQAVWGSGAGDVFFACGDCILHYEPGTRVRGDYDGDGKADPAVFAGASGTWRILQSRDGLVAEPFGWAAVQPVSGDYDGDGKTDLAVYHAASGDWYLQQSSAGFARRQFGWAEALPAPADYDGDGKTDIAVYHPASGGWYVMQSAAGFRRLQFGWSDVVPVPADYDGDGKADITVYHPATGHWYQLLSSRGFAFAYWGWMETVPVAADYDGDGKADVAVYHPADGTWFLNRSSQGFRMQQFGWAAADAVPGDYDGDGKADIAVYHEAGGMWYLLQSHDGFRTIEHGGPGQPAVR
ncbi:MAG: VCBS repeat-containing protein [Kiritimatiellae bacterium]|nr:VCBS repeat-containing protein [Kiritimatiellia bacterium]